MKKILTLGAVLIAAATGSMPAPAEARGGVIIRGLAAGAVIGGLAAGAYGPYGYYGPGYGYHGYGPAYYPGYYRDPGYHGSYAYYGPPRYYRWHRHFDRYNW